MTRSPYFLRSSTRFTMASTVPAIAPTPYHGLSTENAKRWLARLTQFVTLKGCKDEDALAMFGLLLRDSALDWFTCLDESVRKDFTQVKAAFLLRFQDVVPTWQRLSSFFTAKQEPTETVNDFTSRMSMRGSDLSLSSEQIVQATLAGLLSHIRPFVLQKDPTTVEEIRRAANQLATSVDSSRQEEVLMAVQGLADQLQQLTTTQESFADRLHSLSTTVNAASLDQSHSGRRGQPPPSPQKQGRRTWQKSSPPSQDGPSPWHRQPSQTQRACSGCGEYGHLRSYCHAQDLSCYNCGKLGHIARVCRSGRYVPPFHPTNPFLQSSGQHQNDQQPQ
ncbi:uncharacterized protein [Apostichopus japonicus]|uniref:uncharacterized protein n=1 Tax=Stichopus japonicus TaxID=307972 RepID=UPI003AB56AD8